MKILFICEPISPHAARWINQFADTGCEIHILSEDFNSASICKDLKCGTVYLPHETEVPHGVTLITTGTEDYNQHVSTFASIIESIRPDVIHTLGMYVNGTNRCVILAKLREIIPSLKSIPWVYSSWGMDLDWFAKIDEHESLIREILPQLDYHISECDRDIKLIKNLGFSGTPLAKLPAFGGSNWDILNLTPPSERKCILIKARDIQDGDLIGRAFKLFPALLANKDVLANYRIIAMQAGRIFKDFAANLQANYGISIESPERLPKQSDVLDYYKQARIWISLTTNDGLPSSLVEAMSFGTLPLHSDLVSIREWVVNGKNGLLVDLDKPIEISKALREALTNDSLVNNAAAYNINFVKMNWSDEVIKPKALEAYRHVIKQKLDAS